jgi:hypothetical protein
MPRLRAARPPGQPERRAVAVDGKAVRGTRHASGDGHARHLLAVADQQASMVLAQAEVDGKTNEITCFAPLLAPLDLAGAVVTADAMHAQREHAQFLVTEKNAHCILAVKNNQPGLYAQLAICFTCAPSPCGRLSRPPWQAVTPASTTGTPSP